MPTTQFFKFINLTKESPLISFISSMSSSSEPYFILIEESYDTIPQIFYPHECFLIKRHCFHSPSFNHYSFIIPRNILCDHDDFESVDPDSLSNTLLRNAFSVLPDEVLEDTLFLIGDNARHMSRVNFEGDRILKMDVLVGQKGSSTILEKVKLEDIATSISMKECAICLEEFCFGSEEQHIVRTKCMHVFHEQCVTKWIMHCDITNPQYPCPMCRSHIQWSDFKIISWCVCRIIIKKKYRLLILLLASHVS